MTARGQKIERSFFTASPTVCARGLIGCRFEWQGCAAVIVETEAYDAEGDEACHTHSRPSARRFVEENEAGTAYVYLNYGVHWLFNLLVKGERDGFVLFRAMEPERGKARMRRRRKKERDCELCSGPGKLTQAFAIDDQLHGARMFTRSGFAIFAGESEPEPSACPRIGISKAKERRWRFLREKSGSLSAPPSR